MSEEKRETQNVSLTAEQKAFVAAKVASGGYLTASEVIREALRLLEERDKLHDMRLDELRAKIQEGLDALARGEKSDGKEVCCRLEKRMRDRSTQKKKK